jgi:hypothetical protein
VSKIVVKGRGLAVRGLHVPVVDLILLLNRFAGVKCVPRAPMTPKVQRKATLVPRAAASTGDMAEQMAANERRWQDQARFKGFIEVCGK